MPVVLFLFLFLLKNAARFLFSSPVFFCLGDDQYSEDFEKEFLEVLSRRHGTKRVRASLVYNEFIAHKTHTHMNSTHWETLTSFVLYLGKVNVSSCNYLSFCMQTRAHTPIRDAPSGRVFFLYNAATTTVYIV